MKRLSLALRLLSPLLFLALAAPAFAQDANRADANAQDYLQKAMMADQFEIEASQLATRRATSPEVKAFAEMMIKDHTASSEKLAATAKAENIAIEAATLDEGQKLQLDALQGPAPTKMEDPAKHGEMDHSSGDFNADYMRLQLSAHENALGLHRDYADKGGSAALKAAAKEIADKVEHHLAEAKRIAAGLQIAEGAR